MSHTENGDYQNMEEANQAEYKIIKSEHRESGNLKMLEIEIDLESVIKREVVSSDSDLDNIYDDLISNVKLECSQDDSDSSGCSQILGGPSPEKYNAINNNRQQQISRVIVNSINVNVNDKEVSRPICNYKRRGIRNSGLAVRGGQKELKNALAPRKINKIYTCKHCQYKCEYKKALMLHMRTHTGDIPSSIELGESKFEHKSNLSNHSRIHNGEPPFACKLCKSKFKYKNHLIDHMRNHTGEKPYSCNFCDRKFAQRGYLNSHTRTHTGEKPFACNLCKSNFAQKAHLNRHIKTHTGSKPYACQQCEYKFAEKGALSCHMRTHTGDKPYACNLCEWKFARKGNLLSHVRTHTGEKPYACKHCQYKSAGKSSLTRHMRTHTSD